MAREVFRLVHGSAGQVDAYTGPARELVYNDTTKAVHLQDGETPGGRPLLQRASLLEALKYVLADLPTDPAGLAVGDLWMNGDPVNGYFLHRKGSA